MAVSTTAQEPVPKQYGNSLAKDVKRLSVNR